MAIDGVIILDSSGCVEFTNRHICTLILTFQRSRAIIQSGFRSSNPAYPLLHIDALNSALQKAPRPADVDPVLYVSSLQHETPCACCHFKHGDLRFLCPVSGDSECYGQTAWMHPLI